MPVLGQAVRDTDDRKKLIKCLRMFSSHFDGEIASAARRVHELVTSRQLDWEDLIGPVGTQRREERREEPRNGGRQTNSTIANIRRCQALEEHLTNWEREFIGSIAYSIVDWGRLTERQQAVLDRIVNKLKLAGLWEGEPW
jgi:hypothetical protein